MSDRTEERARGVGRRSPRASAPAARLRARWLFIARAAWGAVAITVLAIALFSIPSSFEHYASVCTDSGEVCSERAVGQPTPEGLRALREAGFSVRSYALANVAINNLFQLVWFAVGALIFLRRSDDRMALLTSLFLVVFGTVTVDTTDAEALASSYPGWALPVQGVQVVGEICAALFFLTFPSGRFVPRWTRWLAVAAIAFMVSRDLLPGLYSASPALKTASLGLFCAMVVSLLWAQIYRYRKVSSETQRRQTRWVVFGTALGVGGTFPFQVPVDLSLVGGDSPLLLLGLKTGFTLSFLLLPLSIGVAVLRSRLFDIDVLINRTLVYGALTTLLAAVYLGGVATTQVIFETLTGEQRLPQLAVVASTLVIAALFTPLRRRIQSFIDRRFYRNKYDMRKTLEAFSSKLRDDTDLESLRDDLVGVIEESVQPRHVGLWLRSESAARAEK